MPAGSPARALSIRAAVAGARSINRRNRIRPLSIRDSDAANRRTSVLPFMRSPCIGPSTTRLDGRRKFLGEAGSQLTRLLLGSQARDTIRQVEFQELRHGHLDGLAGESGVLIEQSHRALAAAGGVEMCACDRPVGMCWHLFSLMNLPVRVAYGPRCNSGNTLIASCDTLVYDVTSVNRKRWILIKKD